METYIDSLTDLELEVELQVREIDTSAKTAREILISTLQDEQNDATIIPIKSHITSQPENEVVLAREIYDKLEKITDPKQTYSTLELGCYLQRCIHWKSRLQRLKNSFGDVANTTNWISKFRRKTQEIRNKLDELKLGTIPKTAAPTFTTESKIISSTILPVTTIKSDNQDTSNLKNYEETFSKDPIVTIPSIPISESIMTVNSITPLITNQSETPWGRTHVTPVENINYQIEQGIYPPRSMHNILPNYYPGYLYQPNPMVSHVQLNPYQAISTSIIQPSTPHISTSGLHTASNVPLHNRQNESSFMQTGLNNHRSSEFLPIHFKSLPKWNISFSGSRKSNDLEITEFLFRLECYAKRDRVSHSELNLILPQFLKEMAEKWYWVYARKYPDCSYDQIRTALVNRFSENTDREIRRMIETTKQKSNELFEDFLLEVETLNGRLKSKFSEEELLEIIRDNMDPALQNATLSDTIYTTEALRIICQKYEKLWKKSGYDPRKLTENRSRRNLTVDAINIDRHEPTQAILNEPSSQNSDDNSRSTMQIEALFNRQNNIKCSSMPSQPIKKTEFYVCWNCKDIGHKYQDCSMPLKGIFCFGCGQTGILKPNCSTCHARQLGNSAPGVTNSRGFRPATNPPSSQNTQPQMKSQEKLQR